MDYKLLYKLDYHLLFTLIVLAICLKGVSTSTFVKAEVSKKSNPSLLLNSCPSFCAITFYFESFFAVRIQAKKLTLD